MDYSVDFFLTAESEALQDGGAESAAGGLEVRFRPVDACGVAAVVPAVGVFFAADYDA